MELQYNEQENGIRVVKLIGKLDIVGHGQIESKFNEYCSGEGVRMLVDLSGVEFITSIGIRLLSANAKALSVKNGKMVLLSPIENVMDVLETTGIPDFIPIYSSMESAEAVLLSPA